MRRARPFARRAANGGYGSAFTPQSITSATKRSWHAGDDDDTIVAGTGVAGWLDKFGNGYDPAQATGSKQPTLGSIAGRQALLFTAASSQFLILTSAGLAGVFGGDDTPFTAYIVLQAVSAVAARWFFTFSNSGTSTIYHAIGKNNTVPVSQRQGADAATVAGFTGAISSAIPYLLRARFDGQNMVYILNGVTLTTGVVNNNAALAGINQFVFGAFIGSGAGAGFYDGAIGEAVTYTDLVDVAEETRLVNEHFVPRWPGVS